MNSRVEKYQYDTKTSSIPSRIEKNQNLYNNIDMSELSRIKPNSNIRVIETSPKTIDIEKIKRYVESTIEEMPTRRTLVVKEDVNSIPPSSFLEEKRVYDINSVLEKAKEGRESYYEDEKHKKLRDTQYDILSKIKMYDEEVKEVEVKKEPDFNTDEKTLIDLINTVTINKKNEDLLSELKGNENTVVTAPINEESEDSFITNAISSTRNDNVMVEEKLLESLEVQNTAELKNEELEQLENNTLIKNLDKSFYTNSMSFSKEDFEGFEELEKTVKKNNVLVKVSIVVLIILAIVTIYIVLKYVLNIF